MTIKTIEIRVIEMTMSEQNALWDAEAPKEVCGHKLIMWNTYDGHNQMCLQIGAEEVWMEVETVG